MQNHDEQKRTGGQPEKAESHRSTNSQPGIGRAYRQRWITQQIKKKLLEEGHSEECAICGAKDDLRVNHDTTGLVRGLLCERCDKGLELFEGDPELLRRAIVYLGRTPTRYVFDKTIHLNVKPRRKGRKSGSE